MLWCGQSSETSRGDWGVLSHGTVCCINDVLRNTFTCYCWLSWGFSCVCSYALVAVKGLKSCFIQSQYGFHLLELCLVKLNQTSDWSLQWLSIDRETAWPSVTYSAGVLGGARALEFVRVGAPSHREGASPPPFFTLLPTYIVAIFTLPNTPVFEIKHSRS